tara:strand:- start:3372 stop:3902 length:531 start_codon:yes stop_codon:yes gene_type:complete
MLNEIPEDYSAWTEVQRYQWHREQTFLIAERNGWGDPQNYARGKEIDASLILGHMVNDNYSGPDALDESDVEVEYKSTTGKHCQGSYTGVSVQTTWEEQVKYLKNEKILKYKWHFYNRFESGIMVESWKMPGEDVYRILLPKIKRSWATRFERADPRLSATMSWTEIRRHGKKVYG